MPTKKEDPITKLGRNDPCHCGSGKKYKKCHLASDKDAASQELATKNAEIAEAARLAAEAEEGEGEGKESESGKSGKSGFTKDVNDRSANPARSKEAKRQVRRRGIT